MEKLAKHADQWFAFLRKPTALRKTLRFWENKRWPQMIDSDYHGKVAFLVGAVCVGSATFTFRKTKCVKGDELAIFLSGVPPCSRSLKDRLRISEDAQQHSQANIETFAKMGEEMGRAD